MGIRPSHCLYPYSTTQTVERCAGFLIEFLFVRSSKGCAFSGIGKGSVINTNYAISSLAPQKHRLLSAVTIQ
jgi:hypothetical protein